MKLKNKISIVTGAGKGIGREIAIMFAKEGSRVVVNDIDPDCAKDAAEEICRLGFEAFPVCADVSDESEVNEMFSEVIKKYNGIDILVNNAGIQLVTPFLQMQADEWKKVMDVNLLGTFLCSKAAAPHMIKQNGGKIVNLSSIHYFRPRLNKFHYDASKAGVAIFTEELALELAKYKINVNCIAPGAIETPMNSDILASKESIRQVVSRIPWGRMGKTEDIAKLALFLVSDDSEYITGSIINIDGGRSLL
ncbi:MAG TPA: SDR family NAD(P)-dependent oxidoreductase [Clostridia bacterium]|nr:SDR family NAD(P)-dependent oxidoreductase [Clostridia bacterium]